MRKVDPKDPETGAPQLSGTSLTVAEIVARAYEESVEAAAALATPALEPEEIRAAIDFCADEACTAAAAHCPGCRKWTEREGIQSLDQFCARLASISFGSGLEMTPGGNLAPVSYPSLEALAQRWRGEEYWFLARRVIRRLKKMEAPRPKRLAGTDGMSLDPTLLLVRPQLADNIGMVARAMANFGLDDLRLIDPRDGWPNEKARAAASGANTIIDSTRAFRNLSEAISDLNYVCATTARQRDLAKPVLTPEQAVVEIAGRLAKGERCGIVFGPERTGLETDEIAVADAVVMVPVNPRFASLNLAQAVLLVSYEWLKLTKQGTLGRVTSYETPLEPGLRLRGSPPASKEELLGFFGHLERELERLGFFNPPHKRQTVMRNIQSMFGRMGATSQEVRTLRGIVATLSMGKGKGRKSPT